MAQTTSWGVNEDPGATLATFDLDYANDFRVSSQNSKEAVLTNTASTFDRPESVRVGYSTIANVYTGTGIQPAQQSVTREGVNLLVQVRENLTIRDDADAQIDTVLPFSAHLVMKVPRHAAVTSDHLLWVLKRLVGAIKTGDTLTQGLNDLSRGILVPRAL